MILHQLANNFLKYTLIPLLLFLFLKPCPADSFIDIKPSIGFNDQFSLNKWLPLNIIIENRGRTINGTLEVEITSGNEYLQNIRSSSYSKEVELPYNSKKFYSFTIIINSYIHPLVIRLIEDKKIIASSSINLRMHHTTKKIVISLSDTLSTTPTAIISEKIQFIPVHPRTLPETWYAYDGVEMLIIQPNALSLLTDKQFLALTEWIKKGGYLVSSSEVDYGYLSTKRAQKILSLKIKESMQVYHLNSLHAFCGLDMKSKHPFLIHIPEMKDATVLLKENNIPLITQRNLGLGKIIFLSFDHSGSPFVEWEGRRAFWRKILSMKPRINYPGIISPKNKVLSTMLSNIPARFPVFLTALFFLSAYLVLIKIIFKRIEKPKVRKWKNSILLFTTISFFSITGYFFFYKNTLLDRSYNSFTHLKISGKDLIATGKYIIGLYSMHKNEHHLSFGPIFRPFIPVLSNMDDIEKPFGVHMNENNEGYNLSIPTNKWSARFLEMKTAIDFPIQGDFSDDGKNLSITINNRTQYRIIDCHIYFKNQLFPCEDILPHNEMSFILTPSSTPPDKLFISESFKTHSEKRPPKFSAPLQKEIQKKIMKDLLIAVHSRYNLRHDVLCLLGWINNRTIPINPKKSYTAGGEVSLLEFEIPLRSRIGKDNKQKSVNKP